MLKMLIKIIRKENIGTNIEIQINDNEIYNDPTEITDILHVLLKVQFTTGLDSLTMILL